MEEDLCIRTDLDDQVLRVWYQPKSQRSLYDICDIDGSVIKTGELATDGARIDISDLQKDQYLFLILDGDNVVKRKLNLDER